MAAESSAKALHRSLSEAQRREVCFPWDHRDERRGLLRTFVANHWQVTRPCIRGDFFTREQQHLIHETFTNLVDPAWYPRFILQLRDDTKGQPFGAHQSIALIGDPDEGPFQFLLCGRHITMRADGGSEGRLAFGGPILYGHQATGYYERPNHPGNVFWAQALAASRLADMLDGPQLQYAVVRMLPPETSIGFRAKPEGLAVSALKPDQRRELDSILATLLEPFRAADRERVRALLAKQGGLDACHIMFAREGRMSAPRWDNWRIEGPSFVWHYRGFPHVHVWVHVADDASIEANARKGAYIFPEHDPLR
jgi:uncharacterized protein DUF3500